MVIVVTIIITHGSEVWRAAHPPFVFTNCQKAGKNSLNPCFCVRLMKFVCVIDT